MSDALWAGTVWYPGHEGAELEAYLARPLGDQPRGGVVVIHHMPGYDKEVKEIVRRFAAEGYAAVSPNLYSREGKGVAPDDQAAAARAKGGVPDPQLAGDVQASATYLNGLDGANGRIGTIGYCSGGRQSFLCAIELDVDAVVDCYGAFVWKQRPAEFPLKAGSLAGRIDEVGAPILGLFGNDDKYPDPDEVNELEAALTKAGKDHEFHRYDGAGHAFFAVDRPSYRPAAAVDGWQRILDFYGRHLSA